MHIRRLCKPHLSAGVFRTRLICTCPGFSTTRPSTVLNVQLWSSSVERWTYRWEIWRLLQNCHFLYARDNTAGKCVTMQIWKHNCCCRRRCSFLGILPLWRRVRHSSLTLKKSSHFWGKRTVLAFLLLIAILAQKVFIFNLKRYFAVLYEKMLTAFLDKTLCKFSFFVGCRARRALNHQSDWKTNCSRCCLSFAF